MFSVAHEFQPTEESAGLEDEDVDRRPVGDAGSPAFSGQGSSHRIRSGCAVFELDGRTAAATSGDHHEVGNREADTVYAYLTAPAHDRGVVASLWLLNLSVAPRSVDTARMRSGLPPAMPKKHTKHPKGTTCPSSWQAVWFEEGDGVGVLGDGELLGVIPGWAGEQGFHGYASEAIGTSPLAWALDAARSALHQRLQRAERFWAWRTSAASWTAIRASTVEHVAQRIGEADAEWPSDGASYPPVEIRRHPWRDVAGLAVTTTVGMGGQAMPGVERYHDDPAPYARIELAVAARAGVDLGARLLEPLIRFPWQACTWLGDGHTMVADDPDFRSLGYRGLMFVHDPDIGCTGPPAPDLGGLTTPDGSQVRYLWLVPLHADELAVAEQQGGDAVRRLRVTDRRGWVAT